MNVGKKYVLGVDVGGSHISCALVDEYGHLVEESYNHREVDSGADKEWILDLWALTINETIEASGEDNLRGISFAMPGPFSYLEGVALFKGNSKYESLYGVNIVEELGLRLIRRLKMRFLNDATSFGVGAAWQGKADKVERVLCITLGTGCGSAFMESGIPVVHRADVPKDGCVWHLPFKETLVDDYFSSRWFVKEAANRCNLYVDGVKSLALAARQDQHASDIFNEFGTNLGEMLSPWLSLFNPDMVLLGGSISKAFALFGPALKESIAEFPVSLEYTEDSEMEALRGSARLYENDFWNQVKVSLPKM